MFEKVISDGIRLVLIDSADAQSLYSVIDRNREHLRPWLGWVDRTNSVEDVAHFIIRARTRFEESGDIVAVILLDDQPCGCMGLEDVDSTHSSAEIGYWLGKEFEGMGLVASCGAGLLDHAFDQMGLNRVQLRVSPENHRSKAVARRLGFTYEGTLRQVARMNDRFEDLEFHSLLREEWARSRNRDSDV